MTRFWELLAVRPSERRMASLLVGLMLITAAGSAIGSTGIETLFYSRFGVQYLPYMYVALGLMTFVVSLGITAMLGRARREWLYLALPLGLAALLVGERVVLALGLHWFYPVLWLLKEVVNSLQGGILTWGLAGAVCDTRQAKRLFPLFAAGGILGSVLGGLATGPLVSWLRVENLLFVWAVAFVAAFALGRALLGKTGAAAPSASGKQQPSLIDEMQQGYKFVRRSPLMMWVSVSAVLFSVLFFSLALPFSRAATLQFSSEARLAGFLGIFQGAFTGAAFLVSLFLANRLFERFGMMSMLLAFPVIYLLGFGALAVYPGFVGLVIFRFLQMAWMQGIAGTAWQAMMNVVPIERRDQVRAFVDGVPSQSGTIIAGLILIVGEQSLHPQILYLIGLVAAALTTYVVWQAGRAYNGALVAALRAGQPQLFFSEEQPFGGFRRDAAAVQAAVKGIGDNDAVVRRVSAEILGHLAAPAATAALVGALADPDLHVRAASLRALARADAAPALLDIAASLRDPEPDVRVAAVETLRQLAAYPQGLSAHVRPLLDDPDSAVAARAALALLHLGPDPAATGLLRRMAAGADSEAQVHAIAALGECADSESFDLVAATLADETIPPTGRRAAALALVNIDAAQAVAPLIRTLAADDLSLRNAAADALGKVGRPALPRAAAALREPAAEDGALLALQRLSVRPVAADIEGYARDRIAGALGYHRLSQTAEPHAQTDRGRLLCDSLRHTAHAHAARAFRAIALLADRDTITLAIENLQSRDPNQRANALETLDSIGEPWRGRVRPLFKLWESGEPVVAADERWPDALGRIFADHDPWLRACAALAADPAAHPELLASLTQLAQSDPDAIVRQTASAITGDIPVDTLQTLSLMERILFLRRVSLFGDLSPADLKHVAAVTTERTYSDGMRFARQGETGDEMYIIVSGEVRVCVSTGGGPVMDVARRKPGDYVGEMAIISREPRMASLEAIGDVRVLCLDQKQFEGILRERPETSLAVMRVLCMRLKEKS